MTTPYFSEDYLASNSILEELFKDSDTYVYFIEHFKTREWLTPEHRFTNVPLDALSFKNKFKAVHYKLSNEIEDCIITEHQFI